jgi:DNA-binding transcriptional ArsR family regulator
MSNDCSKSRSSAPQVGCEGRAATCVYSTLVETLHRFDTTAPNFAAARRALSDPIRVRAWEALNESELSANEIAARLSVNPNRLYYHLRILEDADLIEVAGTRKAIKGTERLYRVTNRATGPQLGEGGPEERALFFGSQLDATKADLQDAVFDQATRRRDIRVLRATLVASTEEASELMAAISETIERIRARPEDSPGRKVYRLTFATYDVPDDPIASQA